MTCYSTKSPWQPCCWYVTYKHLLDVHFPFEIKFCRALNGLHRKLLSNILPGKSQETSLKYHVNSENDSPDKICQPIRYECLPSSLCSKSLTETFSKCVFVGKGIMRLERHRDGWMLIEFAQLWLACCTGLRLLSEVTID